MEDPTIAWVFFSTPDIKESNATPHFLPETCSTELFSADKNIDFFPAVSFYQKCIGVVIEDF